jgi:peroxiredoxin Q/BCP
MPLGIFRSRFRKMVYKTDHWSINVKPVFLKETKALLGLINVEHTEFAKTRLRYRLYLLIYILLFLAYKFLQ